MTWGSDTPEDVVLDREKLDEALKKVSKLGPFLSLVSNIHVANVIGLHTGG